MYELYLHTLGMGTIVHTEQPIGKSCILYGVRRGTVYFPVLMENGGSLYKESKHD